MRRLHYLTLPTLLMTMLASVTAHAAPWLESEAFSTLENANAPSCKVDAADLNGDGFIDLVFANAGGLYMGDPGSPLPQQAFMNDGAGNFTDISTDVFGGAKYSGRAVKIRDIDEDGDNDIILGTTWITQTQLLVNNGASFDNLTLDNLPQRPAGVSDVEVGDADDDGDLDIILTNWGEDVEGDEVVNAPGAGGRTMLWSQVAPGTAIFEDLTGTNMPDIDMRVAWDLEFYDVDNDYKLDILASCKWCSDKSLYLFKNDGNGVFSNVALDNVQGVDGHDVEVIDLNNDSFLDIVSLHDSKPSYGRNRVLTNQAGAGFLFDEGIWPMLQNPPTQDYSAAFYDYDSDGDPDLVVGALKAQIDRPDRLMQNDGGVFSQTGESNVPKYQALEETSFQFSSGTCAIVPADFTGDHKLDIAMAQFDNATNKVVYFATDEVAPDTAAPIIGNYQKAEDIGGLKFPGSATLRLRAHDNKSPLMIHDFQADGTPYIEHWIVDPNPDPDANPGEKVNGQWYGEYLWRITFDVPDADEFWYRFCAIDAAGNRACTPVEQTIIEGGTETETDSDNTMSASESDTVNTMGVTATLTDSNSDSFTDSNTMGSASQTEPTDSASDSMTDSNGPVPTESNSATIVSESASASESESDSNTQATASDSSGFLDDDGCGCKTDSTPSGALASLALLGLLGGIRRRRR